MTSAEAAEMGLPDLDYMPSTVEEKIVCHADNLVGDAIYLTSLESYQDFARKGYESTGQRMLQMHKEISDRCGQDVDDIVRQVRVLDHQGPCSKYLKMDIAKWSD
jgi:hypothetical protein